MNASSDSSTRLNKYLALHLGVSRREADDLIANGRVTLNSAPAALGAHVVPTDSVYVDNTLVAATTTMRYVLFHKPIGYVCSRRAQGDTPTIYSLLPEGMHRLKPVGRLDKDSSGVILLTNDGDFAYQMTHPKFHKTKVYEVTLDVPLQPLHRQMISDFGVMLPDGKSQFELERLDTTPKKVTDTHWRITMSEGRNRQIRRTFAALGYTVTALHRTRFGVYELDEVKPGEFQTIKISNNTAREMGSRKIE